MGHPKGKFQMRISVVSSSLDADSRSRALAAMCRNALEDRGHSVDFIDLRQLDPPNFDDDEIYSSEVYQSCHRIIAASDAVILASPVYNWACCAELKKFVEYIGSTPPGESLRGAFFDKVVMFVNSGGLPHSYMAFASLATSLMLDFKCIVSPYNVYAHDGNWGDAGDPDDATTARLNKSLSVLIELAERLQSRSYVSNWEI